MIRASAFFDREVRRVTSVTIKHACPCRGRTQLTVSLAEALRLRLEIERAIRVATRRGRAS